MTNTSQKKFSLTFGKWFLLYTVFFLGIALIVWRPFRFGNKSIIWGYDGLYQTYASMVYFSEYWKEFFQNLILGKPSLPMMDTSVGMGLDVLTTLNYYGFGDILQWISLFFPKEQMEVCYDFLVIFRYYLSGLFFGVYCLYREKNLLPTLAGAFSYVFSGFALYAGVRHPYFLNPWIYFPLLCLGVEQVLEGKKGILLAITTGCAACSNFYFFYMLTILTFLYAVTRYLALYPKKAWKKARSLRVFYKGCGWYLLGVGLGAVVLVPIVFAFLNSSRAGNAAPFANTWFAYPREFYQELFAGFFFPVYSANYWCILSYPSTAFLGLLVLGKKQDQESHVWLGIFFFLLSLLLLIPLGGLAMNGFSYVSHRWLFGYSFCIALLVVLGMENAEKITRKGLLCFTCVFCVLASLYFKTNDFTKQGVGVFAVFFIQLLALFLLRVKTIYHTQKRLVFSWLTTLCVITFAILSAHSLYSEEGQNYQAEFQAKGTAWPQMTDLSEVVLKNSEESDGFFRVEGDTTQVTNWGMINRVNGTNAYFSLMKKEIHDYALDMENPDLKFSSWYNGLGDRAPLMSLNNVRYFAKREDSLLAVPYGYSEKLTVPGLGTLYESPYAMPIGYTYDALLPHNTWETLPAIRKQQALMQAALLDEEGAGWCLEHGVLTDGFAPEYREESLPYTISSMDGVTWNQEEGRLFVDEGGGEICIDFESRPDSETYLRICGFDIEPSGYELLHFFAGTEGTELKKIYCTSSLSSWSGQLKNFLVSVTGEKAKLSFPFGGEYELKGLEMYALPMDSFAQQAMNRKEESLEAALSPNRIQGTVQVSGNRILCVSIPYSKGWKATVDGKQVPVWKCNDMHLGIFLNEGEHQVVFSYQTPGLAAGAVISVLALILLFFLGRTVSPVKPSALPPKSFQSLKP